jgi:phosphoenolpyruvate carboxykinase (GTP)
MRVLKWIVDRVNGQATAVESPIGFVPRYEDIEWTGLNFSKDQFDQVMLFDREAWAKEVIDQEVLFYSLRDRLPKQLKMERELLINRF